jgi:predicted ATPase
MIKEVTLRNFYSFKDCTIPLNKDVNIAVGINGSGKSNLLKAIALLKEGVSGVGLKKHVIDTLGGFDNIFYKGSSAKKAEPIQLIFRFDKDVLNKYGDEFPDDVIYSIILFKQPSTNNYYVKEKVKFQNTDTIFDLLHFENGRGVLMEENSNKERNSVSYINLVESTELALSKIFDSYRFFHLSVLRKEIGDIAIYTNFNTTPTSPIRRPILATSESKLLADGANLPQILNTLKISNKNVFNQIIAKLNEVNPQFKDIDFNFIGGNIELMLEESNFNSSVHVSNISDGTLRFLCLLSVLYNPDSGSLICIDEPETGLHPDMISTISNAILDASGKSSLIIPTHSDKLLNHFEIEHVRVFEKNTENASVVLTHTKEEFEGWYEDFSLGNMWRAGDIGGNRY